MLPDTIGPFSLSYYTESDIDGMGRVRMEAVYQHVQTQQKYAMAIAIEHAVWPEPGRSIAHERIEWSFRDTVCDLAGNLV